MKARKSKTVYWVYENNQIKIFRFNQLERKMEAPSLKKKNLFFLAIFFMKILLINPNPKTLKMLKQLFLNNFQLL